MKNYHIFIYGCGICATGTPCESGIPIALKKEAGKILFAPNPDIV